MTRGDLFIVSAPSGAGKTTLLGRLIEMAERMPGKLEYSVSHTTREPRAGEVQGRDYHFVDQTRFRQMIEEGRFLEWAEFNGNLYGSSKEEVLPRLESGVDVLLEIEVQGAEQVLKAYPEAQAILILPPSFQELEKRLRKRALDKAESIAGRLAVSRWEIERYELFDYVIINRDLERASEALAAVLLARRHRLERMMASVKELLAAFRLAERRD